MEPYQQLTPITTNHLSTIDQAIAAWINAKAGRSGSRKTKDTYRDTLLQFRAALHQVGADLDSDPKYVRLAAQGWAQLRSPEATREDEIAAATYNQRLAILSSFYTYARAHELLDCANPIEIIERRPVQPYRGAIPLDYDQVKEQLAEIPRESMAGKRDYALLSVALHTGRRASELAGMRWGHIHVIGKKVRVHWPHCKGGKVMDDELPAGTASALMSYLHAVYGSELGHLSNDAAVWLSFARNASRFGAISTQAIADIVKKHLGTSKVHATRHTFAHAMQQVGATVNDIKNRLGHSSIAVTGTYLDVMNSAENKHGRKLENLFGIEEE